jgi:UDP-glucuronate decarboxylase
MQEGYITELRNKTILITGGNGLIASTMIDMLAVINKDHDANISIYALCRGREKAEKRFAEYLQEDFFHLLIQDVCDPVQSDSKFDYVVHAAGNAHPLAFSTDPVGTMKTSMIGTINLLEYAIAHNTQKFLLVSSSEIYGENPSLENGFHEDSWGRIDSMDPRSCYSEGKRAAESLCASYGRQYGLHINAVRPGYIYGGAITGENSRADAQFLRNAVYGEDIVLKSTGSQLRSYCYVKDCVTGILTVLAYGEAGMAYNIASRKCEATVREFAETVAEIAGVGIHFEIPPDLEKQGYSKVTKAILNPARLEALGWEAKYMLREGLSEAIVELRTAIEKI